MKNSKIYGKLVRKYELIENPILNTLYFLYAIGVLYIYILNCTSIFIGAYKNLKKKLLHSTWFLVFFEYLT